MNIVWSTKPSKLEKRCAALKERQMILQGKWVDRATWYFYARKLHRALIERDRAAMEREFGTGRKGKEFWKAKLWSQAVDMMPDCKRTREQMRKRVYALIEEVKACNESARTVAA